MLWNKVEWYMKSTWWEMKEGGRCFHLLSPFIFFKIFSWVQSLSCIWLCDSMDCSAPGLPVHHQLAEFTQTQVHWVGDAIQTSHPLSSPFPSAPNPSQHQSLFQWVSSSHLVAKILELKLCYQSTNEYSGLISSRVDWFDLLAVQGTLKSFLHHHTIQKNQFFGT